MKDIRKDDVIDFHSASQKSTIETAKEKVNQSLFNLLIVLIKNQKVNLWFETICLLFQLLQLIAFPFHPIFASVWKNKAMYEEISNTLQYFRLTLFFKNNKEMYLIAFYLCVFIVVFLYIDVIYVAFALSNNRLSIIWPLLFLQSSLLLFVNAFYLPIQTLLLSMLSCLSTENRTNYYIDSIQCWSGEFYLHGVFGIVFAVLFFCFCLFFQMTFFETKFNSLNPLTKSSSKSDVVFFCSKTLLIIIFTFFLHTDNQWFIIIVMLFISFYLLYYFSDAKPYYHNIIAKNHIGTYIIFLWSNIVLVIAKIMIESAFNGAVGLFLIGTPVIIITIAFQDEDIIPILLTNFSKYTKGEKALIQIREYFSLISQRNSSRNVKIKLKGYVIQYEEQCSFTNCALKKYLMTIQNADTDAFVFLLQHGEMLYQNAIARFTQCNALRIAYACFLLEQMNKKRQAELELSNAEKQCHNLEEQFIIFRYRRLLEEFTTEINENEDNLDIVSNLAYKNHMTLFKSSINRVSMLYLDFWSLLLNPNQDNHEDLTKLNDYGTKINGLVEEVNSHFNKMQKLKLNDQEALKYYADFLNDILNDKEKAMQYKSKIKEIEDTTEGMEDNNLVTADLNAVNFNDEFQFIIASAQADKFGIITQLSLGICSMFGYTKVELMGKTIEVLIPDIYHKGHRSILSEKVNDFKRNLLDINEVHKYKPVYAEQITFGKSKSRYLVPITFKTALIPTESNDIIFVAKIWMENNALLLNSTQQFSYIMTNNYFIIQNFTANAVNMLGLNSKVLSNNVEVTDFIKQFHEYFLRYAVENEDKTPEQKLMIKRNLISKKFNSSTYINWKKNDTIHLKVKNSRHIDIYSTIANEVFNENSILSNILNKTYPEDKFMMTVSEIIVNKTQEGYVFKFEPVLNQITSLIEKTNMLNGDGTKMRTNKSNSQLHQDKDKENSSNKDMIPSKLKVDASFIPDVNKGGFQLDAQSLAFQQGGTNLIDLKDYLRKEAVKKLQSNTSNSDNSSIDNNNEDGDSNSSHGSGSEVYCSSMENNSSVLSNEMEEKRSLKQKCIIEDYYKVNVQHIKYSCYDYAKGMIVEIKNIDKTSQIQKKMSNDDRDNKDESSLKKKEDPNTSNIVKDIVQDQMEKDKRKENLLLKQIEYALGKEESQPTITKMRWIFFAVFLMLLSFGSSIMSIIMLSLTNIKENIALIEKAFDLVILNSIGIYYCRELTLLHNTNYSALPLDRELYLNETFNNTLSVFVSSHSLITYIITTFLTISKGNSFLLLNSSLMSAIIEDDFNVSHFNMSHTSAFIEVNTALFHIGHSELQKIVMTNKDAFFYLHNSLNEIEIAFEFQANALLNELKLNTNRIRLIFSLILALILLLLVIIFFVLSFGFNGIARRKESYLEVFFEIGNGVIRSSLEKCENFTKKFQTDSIHDTLSSSEEDNEMTEESLVLAKEHDKKEQKGKKRNRTSREAKVIKMNFAFMLMFIGLFAILDFVFYVLYLTKLEGFMEYYKNTVELNNEYLLLFNGLREFMFDKNSKVMKSNSLLYLNTALEQFYSMKQNKTKFITQYQSLIPGNYSSNLKEIYKESSCTLNTYFTSMEECSTFMSNSTNYGLDIALSYFIEEIRLAKNNADQFHHNQTATKFTYNLTLTGTDLWKSYFPENERDLQIYKAHDSINLFNDTYLHLKLNTLFSYVILPNFNHLVTVLKQTYDSSLKSIKLIYIIITSIYLCLVLTGYIFVWLPYQTKMNQTIYKTKNMLSIIPKEVLASLSNIHKLLNINQNALKGTIRNAT